MDNKSTCESLEQEIKKLKSELGNLQNENSNLKEQMDMYHELFHNAGVPITVVDPENGKFILFNREGHEFLGYTREEFLEMTIFDTMVVDDPDLDRRSFTNEHIERPVIREGKVRAKNGELKYVMVVVKQLNFKGKTYIHSAVIDISELKKVERELKGSREFSFSILENTPSPIMVINRDYRAEYVNPAMLNLTGFSKQELLGKTAPFPYWDEYVPEEKWRDALLEGLYNVEFSFRKKNGERFWVLASSTPIKIQGELQYSLSTWIDITEIKKAQDEEENLRIKFERAQRMEALGTLAGGIAHDFNNLLMGIQGRTSLLLAEKTSSDQDNEHLKGIEEYVKSAASLTMQLLGFARGGKYELKPVNMNDLLMDNADMFGRMKKEINIHKKLHADLWTSEVDQGQLNQVFMNLFVNAWQAMPGGGNLYIETENVDMTNHSIKPYNIKEGRYVKISITDNGVGMDRATMEKIFDPFFTTREMGRGTGLGLASVYGIMKNHGGYIDVYSEKGEGTTFKLYLPASNKEAVKEEVPVREIISGNEKILLVDDEDLIIEVGKGLLEKLGYSVLTADNGKDALQVYNDNMNDIDIVVLDMIIPGMNGGEIFDRLKEINPDIKVILSSGYSMNGQAVDIMEKGCSAFIQKPFDLQTLSQKLREVLDRDKPE